MEKHPIDFLRDEFIEPMGVTQNMLHESLNMSMKTISELYQHKRAFTVSTARKFGQYFMVDAEQLLQMQVKYDLAMGDKNSFVRPFEVPSNTKSVLNLLNQKSLNEYTFKDLHNLFGESTYKNNGELVELLFKSVPLNKIVKYMLDMGIGLSHLKRLYSYYTEKLNGKSHASFERLLMDDDKTALTKVCDNGEYFDDPRDFEQYLFYRLSFLHKKKLLLDMSKDKTESHTVRQRALYLYSFATGHHPSLDFKPKPTNLYDKTRRTSSDTVNEYGLLSTLDTMRYKQFVMTGNF